MEPLSQVDPLIIGAFLGFITYYLIIVWLQPQGLFSAVRQALLRFLYDEQNPQHFAKLRYLLQCPVCLAPYVSLAVLLLFCPVFLVGPEISVVTAPALALALLGLIFFLLVLALAGLTTFLCRLTRVGAEQDYDMED